MVEGITEWLPISSTGHLLILERLVPFTAGGDAISNRLFFSFFLIVIQLGAVMAVVVTFWQQLWPFPRRKRAVVPASEGQLINQGSFPPAVDHKIMRMWMMILIACAHAAVIGVLFDEKIEAIF
ncbi:MAG: undecaprenyl-diphosphate phosphatase, partial [Clostridiaceae bacterium]|nr:undecaprenyl-diphosphate phosphatase [Clostridiaceae bacterium]